MERPVSACARRVFLFASLAGFLVASPVRLDAQYEPTAPVGPSSLQECNVFATAVNQFLAAMTSAHDRCLASNSKTSKPLPEANNGICSQPACQRYHDFVFGPMAAEENRKVSACFAEVNQYQSHKREEERLRAQQHEQIAQREKQRQQEEADRGKLVAERAAWEAREEKRKQTELQRIRDAEARLKAAKDEASRQAVIRDRDNELARIKQERAADIAPIVPFPTVLPYATDIISADPAPNRDAALQPPLPQPGKEVLAEIKGTDPFGDPFPAGATRTPYAADIFEKTSEIATRSTDEALSSLDRDIESARKAGNLKYAEAAADTRSVLYGIGKMVKYADYAVSAGKIANADTDKQREEAIGELGAKVASDIAKQGLEKYAGLLFGKKIAAVLLGPVAFVASIGADVLTSTPTTQDPQEIILDNSGSSSLNDKREALYTMWRQYSHYGGQWQPVQKLQLLELTGIVYANARQGVQ